MSHLTLEALARLVDEEPSTGERVHLGTCVDCREELAALRGQSDALAALPKMVPAPDAWLELRGRLLDERVITSPAAPAQPTRGAGGPAAGRAADSAAGTSAGQSPRWSLGTMRAAAAVILFITGGVLGYGMNAVLAASPGGPATASEAVAGGNDEGTDDPPSTELAASPAGLQEVEAAQEAFLSALDEYMAATGSAPSDPAARLATLDNIVLTTAEALNEAPADPVINSFHLTALAQRNAMLRQLASAAPDPVF